MLKLYMILFGLFQVLAAFSEFITPVRMFRFWKIWVLSKYFPAHGIFLIAGGFPLLLFKGSLEGIIFWIGVFMVLTGPFLLIYPEKLRDVFKTAENDFTPRDLRLIVHTDAFIRLAAGIIVIIACYNNFKI